jgi:hypothetical protein
MTLRQGAAQQLGGDAPRVLNQPALGTYPARMLCRRVALAVAFAHLEEHELSHPPLESEPPPEGCQYGLCRGRDARRLFFDT